MLRIFAREKERVYHHYCCLFFPVRWRIISSLIALISVVTSASVATGTRTIGGFGFGFGRL